MHGYISLIVITLCVVVLTAFKPEDKKTKVPTLKTYFACKQTGKMVMTYKQFLQFMSYPLCAKDENDSLFKVTRFELIYAETGLYQDSAGLPIVHTDYQFSNMKGDTINHIWKKMFAEHAYKGDTIKIKNVRAVGTNNKPYRSSDIELILR